MSKLRAQGNASGTGVFTLETPATNTDRTITLPDSTGTLLNNGDAISLADSVKATFGASDDLQIFHAGTNSYIEDAGTGDLIIKGADVKVVSSDSEPMATFTRNGAASLYYDNATKLSTTSTGATVTGSLGIGTSSPSAKLSIETGGDEGIRLYRSGSNANFGAIEFRDSTDANTNGRLGWNANELRIEGTSTITATTNNSERMRIDSSGNTFWGTTSLHETNNQGGISLWNIGNYNRQILQIGHTDSGNRTVQQFFGNSSETPAGVISCTGVATTYATSSDYRLKENVVPMSASIDRLKQLNPVNFNFIADATTTVDGFLAHEAQAVVPEAVTGTKDAMQTKDIVDEDGNVTGTKEIIKAQAIDQSKLVPLLTSALQEAVAKIEALEQRVTTLEGGTV